MHCQAGILALSVFLIDHHANFQALQSKRVKGTGT